MNLAPTVGKARGTIVLLALIHAINAGFMVTTKQIAPISPQMLPGNQLASKCGVGIAHIAVAFS